MQIYTLPRRLLDCNFTGNQLVSIYFRAIIFTKSRGFYRRLFQKTIILLSLFKSKSFIKLWRASYEKNYFSKSDIAKYKRKRHHKIQKKTTSQNTKENDIAKYKRKRHFIGDEISTESRKKPETFSTWKITKTSGSRRKFSKTFKTQ